MTVQVDSALDRVDWDRAKAKLRADRFDNGRSPAALRRSFEQSQHAAFAWVDGELVGMARMLSDGVCNAYLLDVWTESKMRGQGIATKMIDYLAAQVPGQHMGLQTDDAQRFYATRLPGAAPVHEPGRRTLAGQRRQQLDAVIADDPMLPLCPNAH